MATYREGLARIRERRPFQYLELLAFVGALGAAGERRQVDRLRRRYRELLDQLAADEPLVHATLMQSIRSARRRCR